MSARVLLVTGSRALTDTRESMVWARSVLRERITSEVSNVVAGDARGPDEWAHESARTGLWLTRWCLNGDVRTALAGTWWTEGRWLPEGTPLPSTREAWAQRALARNKAMVDHAAEHTLKARALALLAPWSRTRGTQHTMRLAREHGLSVEVLVCPEAYGPRGGR